MTIPFSSIPANMQRPLFHVEVDPSKAGTLSLVQAAVLIGQMISSGTANTNEPIAVSSQSQADALFGRGSMLASMFRRFFANNIGARLYAIAVPDPSGTAAEGTIEVTAAPTAAGTIPLYIAGTKVAVAVLGTETAAQTATKINAAINADTSLPVTSTVLDDTVTVTCRWDGTTGNDIRIELNYYGQIGDEELPASFAATITAMSGGAGVPSFTSAITALGDDLYDYVAFPYTDDTSLGAIAAEYGFGDTGRWGYDRELFGTVFSARRDSYANLMTWGASKNYPTVSIMAVESAAPAPVWDWVAAYTARAARAFLNDPGRPLQTLELLGCLPAKRGARFNNAERNNLALTGMAIMTWTPNNTNMIEREVMSYQENVYGQSDTAYHDCTTLHTLAYILRRLKSVITNKYPRHKLANDGTRYAPGSAIITPKTVKAELVSQYRQMEYEGMVENVEAFKENTIVERNQNDPTRLDILYAPDLINQARVIAVLAQFRLQYSTVSEI